MRVQNLLEWRAVADFVDVSDSWLSVRQLSKISEQNAVPLRLCRWAAAPEIIPGILEPTASARIRNFRPTGTNGSQTYSFVFL